MSKESIYKGVQLFRAENTEYVEDYINRHESLKETCRRVGKDGIAEVCFEHARKHGDQFGNRFVLELYDVFWDKVWNDLFV